MSTRLTSECLILPNPNFIRYGEKQWKEMRPFLTVVLVSVHFRCRHMAHMIIVVGR